MTEPAADAQVAGDAGGRAAAVPDEATLPDVVKAAVLRFAADVLGATEPRDTPVVLRAVRQFAPRRRAEAGAGPLWAALAADEGFRARVARAWSQAHPDLAERLTGPVGAAPDGGEAPPRDPGEPDERPATSSTTETAGGSPATSSGTAVPDLARADPVLAAAGAWLLRAPAWRGLADRAAPAVPPSTPTADRRLPRLEAEAARLRAELGVAREAERAARDELAGLQRELRRLRADADRARGEARKAGEDAASELAAARAALDEARREREAAAADRTAAEQERSSRRAQARAGAQLDQVRARLLLDSIVGAASGLRDELALPPVGELRPADLVAGDATAPVATPGGSRGRAAEDPALLDELLRLPAAHLVVDGYNVTKTGWPALTLEEQRRRLVDALALLASRSGAEVTCCFDGQLGQAAVAQPRGVRVLFSQGEIADDLIRRLVRAEPPGRVVVVITGDQAVAADVTRAGAVTLPSTTLLARLQRV